MHPSAYKRYLLTVLTVILVFNYVDRLALGIVLQDIKTDLQLTDTQLGFLSGIAFALFYAIMGIPIARWADRGNRVMIISLTVLVWSAAVALSGTATSYVQLLLIRVAVATGEAGCIPPALSLLADYYERTERPRATALYAFAGVLSAVVGYLVAGWLNEFYGWRVMFVILGLPGLAMAAIAWWTLKEPRARVITAEPVIAPPSMLAVARTLWANSTFRNLLLCFSIQTFFMYGIGMWHVPFYIRTYGLTTGEIGTWLTIVWGVGGVLGTYLAGNVTCKYAAGNERLQLRAMAIALSTSGVLTIGVYHSSTPYLAFTLMGLAAVGLTTVNGPLLATIQTLVPEHIRAVSFALVYLVANLIGAGLGPLATGVLSDFFQPWAGEHSLRYALLLLAPGYFWVAWHAWRASHTVTRDVARSLELAEESGNG